MTTRCTILVSLACVLALPLGAQEEQKPPGSGRTGQTGETGTAGATGNAGDPDQTKEGVVDPAGADPNVVKNEAGMLTFMAPVVSTLPQRLAPGETGELVVVLSLQSNAVVLPSDTLTVTYEPTQGPLALGSWAALPAKPSLLYPRFKEQTLWEKYLQFSMPISVAAKTAHGKYQVKLAITVQVTNGLTGDRIATPHGEVTGDVVVGNPVPRPAVAIPAGKTGSAATPAGAGTSKSAPAAGQGSGKRAGEAPPRGGKIAGQDLGPGAGEPARHDAAAGSGDEIEGGESGTLMLWLIAAVLGLGILIVVLMRVAGR
jgi:hypothetical protein